MFNPIHDQTTQYLSLKHSLTLSALLLYILSLAFVFLSHIILPYHTAHTSYYISAMSGFRSAQNPLEILIVGTG